MNTAIWRRHLTRIFCTAVLSVFGTDLSGIMTASAAELPAVAIPATPAPTSPIVITSQPAIAPTTVAQPAMVLPTPVAASSSMTPASTIFSASTPTTEFVPPMLSARHCYHRGVYAFLTGDLTTAEMYLQESVGKYERDPRPWFFLGLARLRQGDTATATMYFQKGAAIETGPLDHVVSVNDALEPIQGPERQEIERCRHEARLMRAETQRLWYENRYTTGDWPGTQRMLDGLSTVAAVKLPTLSGVAVGEAANRKLDSQVRTAEKAIQAYCKTWNEEGDQLAAAISDRNAWPGLTAFLGVKPDAGAALTFPSESAATGGTASGSTGRASGSGTGGSAGSDNPFDDLFDDDPFGPDPTINGNNGTSSGTDSGTGGSAGSDDPFFDDPSEDPFA